jgi:hypothetical protein
MAITERTAIKTKSAATPMTKPGTMMVISHSCVSDGRAADGRSCFRFGVAPGLWPGH